MVLIVDGSTTDIDAEKVAKRICQTIINNQGEIIHFNKWGRRKLSYLVRGKEYGYYFVIYFKDSGISAAQLQRQISLDEFALKALILKCDDIKPEQELFEKLLANPSLHSEQYSNFQQKD